MRIIYTQSHECSHFYLWQIYNFTFVVVFFFREPAIWDLVSPPIELINNSIVCRFVVVVVYFIFIFIWFACVTFALQSSIYYILYMYTNQSMKNLPRIITVSLKCRYLPLSSPHTHNITVMHPHHNLSILQLKLNKETRHHEHTPMILTKFFRP